MGTDIQGWFDPSLSFSKVLFTDKHLFTATFPIRRAGLYSEG